MEPKESSTVVPMVHPQDAEGLSWLLPRDFVNDIYSPKRSISFNYAKFGGDYDSVLDEWVFSQNDIIFVVYIGGVMGAYVLRYIITMMQ